MNHNPVRFSLVLRELKGRKKNTVQTEKTNRLLGIVNGSRLRFNEISLLPVRQMMKPGTAATPNVVDPTRRRSERREETVTMTEEAMKIRKKVVKQQNVVAAVETMKARQTKAVRHHATVAVPVPLTT
jgi:hypothetical protein